MTVPNPGVEKRLHLVKANRSSICIMLCRAVSGGLSVSDAVVVVADTSDEVGRELSEAAAEKAGLSLNDEATRVQERGEIPTTIMAIPVAAAKAIFGDSHPSVAAGLDRAPLPDAFGAYLSLPVPQCSFTLTFGLWRQLLMLDSSMFCGLCIAPLFRPADPARKHAAKIGRSLPVQPGHQRQ